MAAAWLQYVHLLAGNEQRVTGCIVRTCRHSYETPLSQGFRDHCVANPPTARTVNGSRRQRTAFRRLLPRIGAASLAAG